MSTNVVTIKQRHTLRWNHSPASARESHDYDSTNHSWSDGGGGEVNICIHQLLLVWWGDSQQYYGRREGGG